MPNVAILVGNNQYTSLSKLDCCDADVAAMSALLEASKRFETIKIVQDAAAKTLKEELRTIAADHKPSEIFFYFSGHGTVQNGQFFFCPVDFDNDRPNETGLSTDELHDLLRSMEATLVVKVIDACNSGSPLIKSEAAPLMREEPRFKNFIQIASCMETQQSLAGSPLSEFTEKFQAAVLKERDGPVYYTDIENILRDDYLNEPDRTPYFTTQRSGRETFADNARMFDELRQRLASKPATEPPEASKETAPVESLSFLTLLQHREASFANKDRAQAFISEFFSSMKDCLSKSEIIADLYEYSAVEHSDFQEPTTKAFIIRALSVEKRLDKFVTAETVVEMRRRSPGSAAMAVYMDATFGAEEVVRTSTLELNCSMEKIQLRITFTPRFHSLKQFVLVMTCVPSLDHCSIFLMLTAHSLRDWDEFDFEGEELTRRWSQAKWIGSGADSAAKFCEAANKALGAAVDKAQEALRAAQ